MGEPTVCRVLAELGEASDDGAAALASTLSELAERQGPPSASDFAGPGERALAVVGAAVARAETAERQLSWTRQQLPEAEARLAQLQKAARGRLILPLVLLVIVLVVLVGQLL